MVRAATSSSLRACPSAVVINPTAKGVISRETAMLLQNMASNQHKPMKQASNAAGCTIPTFSSNLSTRRRAKWTFSQAMSTK